MQAGHKSLVSIIVACALALLIGIAAIVSLAGSDPVKACIDKGVVPLTRVNGSLLELVECKFKEAK